MIECRQSGGSVGIGFAIPINMVKDLLPQLKMGKVIRGWIGVIIQKVTPELKDKLNPLCHTHDILILRSMSDSDREALADFILESLEKASTKNQIVIPFSTFSISFLSLGREVMMFSGTIL